MPLVPLSSQRHALIAEQVAAMGIQSSSKVLNRLIARDAHNETNIGGGDGSQRSFPEQVSMRAPTRFQLRQAALRGPSSVSSSQSTSINDSKSFGSSGFSSSSANISGQDVTAAASPSPAHRQPPPPGGGALYPQPAPLERTQASILRAASASPVPTPSHLLLLFSEILNFFSQALPSVLRRRAQELQDSVAASSSDAATAHAPLAGGQPVRRAAAALSHGLISSRMLQQPPVQPAEPSVAQVQAGQAGGMRSRFGQA